MITATHPVGVVGIGLVGLAIVERLRAARIKVLGYDVDAARRDALVSAGGVAAASANDVFGSCDNVVLALYDGGQTSAVMREAIAVLAPGTLVLDCGTGDPDQVVALAVRLAARGVRLVDGPLSGSSQQIREGSAVMMMGGDREACDALEPVLAAIAPRHFLLGPPGSGARAKLATNLLLGLNRAALAEALVFAEALGIDLPSFLELCRTTPAYSRAIDAKGKRMIEGEFAPPQSRITQHRKDVNLMIDAAQRAGHVLPLTTTHAALLDAAIAEGAGDLDNAAIIETIRRWRGSGRSAK
jgi:3-hydroxyisobutyrate dehydrogenase-like beta-hydroxyacid dehydrogenase